jgi:hypothetical protein
VTAPLERVARRRRVASGGRTAIPAAASVALRRVLTGPPVPARTLAVFPQAIYLRLEHPLATADLPPVLSLVTTSATAQPGSVALARGCPLPACHPGALASVGNGHVSLGRARVATTRWWDPTPRPPRTHADQVRRRADGLEAALRLAGHDDAVLRDRAARVVAALHLGDADAAVAAGRRLLGYGPGLTPAGDDVLSGLFVAASTLLRAVGSGRDVTMAQRGVDATAQRLVAAAREVTTVVSHASLWHAARRQAAGPVADVVVALAGRG